MIHDSNIVHASEAACSGGKSAAYFAWISFKQFFKDSSWTYFMIMRSCGIGDHECCIHFATLSNKSWFARFRLLPTMDSELSLQSAPSKEFLISFSSVASGWGVCHKMIQSKGKGIKLFEPSCTKQSQGLEAAIAACNCLVSHSHRRSLSLIT